MFRRPPVTLAGPSAAADGGGCGRRAFEARSSGFQMLRRDPLRKTSAKRFTVDRNLIRVLALLMAIVLPLRVVAASVVPILGMPGHGHQHQHDRDTRERAAAAAPDRTPTAASAVAGAKEHFRACVAQAAQAVTLDDELLENGCPHLGMAGVSAPALLLAGTSERSRVCRAPATLYASVILDVPSPPPTARD